jgi:membrane-bound serine protease (ClpP class)
LVHAVGVARTDLLPVGKIVVHGEIWDARANDNVLAGKPVRVCAVEGLTLVVEPVTQNDK